MTHDLLCSWLNLAPSPWPPTHYILLGLPVGEASTEEIERRALERMDLLRRYQLMHPEQVTEGMNLLAQAIVCLTDPESRRRYDAAIGLAPVPQPTTPPSRDTIPLVEAAAPSRIAAAAFPALPETLIEPPIVYEYVDETTAPPLPLRPPEEEERPSRGENLTRPVRKKKPRKPLRPTEQRRKIYADLVRIRRVLRVWERLRTYLDDPERAFSRRTETITFMSWLTELRPLLPTVADLVGGINQPGSLTAALARQQLIVEMFRSLLPSQREALSRDCRQAHFIMLERYQSLRAELRRQTAKSFARRYCYPVLREIILRPEWLILATGIIALIIAFIRSVPR